MEPQWNPSVENQAIARALRLGQAQAVQVTRYVISGTVEQVSCAHISTGTIAKEVGYALASRQEVENGSHGLGIKCLPSRNLGAASDSQSMSSMIGANRYPRFAQANFREIELQSVCVSTTLVNDVWGGIVTTAVTQSGFALISHAAQICFSH